MKRHFEDHCWKDVVPTGTLEIYQSYERDLFVGEKPALLLIDLYNSAFEGGSRPVMELLKEYPASCGEYAWNAIKPTLELIGAARQAGIPVVHVTVDTRPQTDIPGGKASHRRRATISATTFELKEEFQPQAGDLVVYKKRASGFYGTPLASHLNRMDVKSLIVAGETTSGCVRATVADAYSCGFHTVVAEECCFDRAPLPHKMNLFDMHHKYADVMHLDEIVEELGGRRVRAA